MAAKKLHFECMTTSCCAPQEGCEYCKTSRRIRETYYSNTLGRRCHHYVHLRKDAPGFIDCAIQDEGKPYDARNKGATSGRPQG